MRHPSMSGALSRDRERIYFVRAGIEWYFIILSSACCVSHTSFISIFSLIYFFLNTRRKFITILPSLARQKSGYRVSAKEGRHSRHVPLTILCHPGQSLKDTFNFYNNFFFKIKKIYNKNFIFTTKILLQNWLGQETNFLNLNTELFQVQGSSSVFEKLAWNGS